MEVKIKDQKIEVVIQRKKIKNMYLRIKEGTIFITAHPSVPLVNIESFISSKENWIEKAYQQERKKRQINSKGIHGPILYLWGEKKYVRYELSNRNYVELNDDIFTFYVKEIKDEIILATFQKFAKPLLMKILESQRMRWDRLIQDYYIQKVPKLKIRLMTSQWGNCLTSTGLITMNLSLIHYPVECIDYVLLHEYVHLIVPNHSKRFYQIIEMNMPEYKKYINMLK